MKKMNLSNFPPLPTITQSSRQIKNQYRPRDNNDQIRVLKIKFAKKEITKEQYEEMRKPLE
jgi:uncharacterized membrane protein